MEFLYVVLWIILSFVVAVIAGNRKLGFITGLVLSIILSPVIGLIIALVTDKRDWDTEDAEKMMKKGMKKLEKGDYQDATNLLKKALEKKNDMPELHYNMAVCYNHSGQHELALKHLARAVELGFADYERIENDYNLEKLRQTDKFKEFSDKGYKL